MQYKKLYIFIFVLVAAIQIYVPAKMVYDSELILDEGAVYKFKAAPVDPNDPFRGKYITLSYDIDAYEVDIRENWERGESVYVLLRRDEDGFAQVLMLSKDRPGEDVHYVKATVGYVYNLSQGEDSLKKVNLNFPFVRYYMEESKALPAEMAYRESTRDTSITTYALIHIKDGQPMIKNVMIGDVPIREIVMNANKNL